MAKKKSVTSNRVVLRVYNQKVISDIDRVLAVGNRNYSTVNAIINRAVEYGLPKVLAEVDPQTTIEDIVSKQADRVIAHINRIYNKIDKKQNRIYASIAVNEEMTNTALHELELLLDKNNIAMSSETRSSFMVNLLPPFNGEFDLLLGQITDDDNT